MDEYRWENCRIGQGHYSLDLEECSLEAKAYSKDHPEDEVIVQLWKPKAQRSWLMTFRKGKLDSYKRISRRLALVLTSEGGA